MLLIECIVKEKIQHQKIISLGEESSRVRESSNQRYISTKTVTFAT